MADDDEKKDDNDEKKDTDDAADNKSDDDDDDDDDDDGEKDSDDYTSERDKLLRLMALEYDDEPEDNDDGSVKKKEGLLKSMRSGLGMDNTPTSGDADDADDVDGDKTAPANKKKFMIMGGVGFVLLIAIAGGVVFAMKGGGDDPITESANNATNVTNSTIPNGTSIINGTAPNMAPVIATAPIAAAPFGFSLQTMSPTLRPLLLPPPEEGGDWSTNYLLKHTFYDSSTPLNTGDSLGAFISCGGDYIAIGVPYGKKVLIYKKRTWELVISITKDDYKLGSVGVLSKDGTRLALGSPEDNVVLIYDTATWQLNGEIKSPNAADELGAALSLSNDGNVLAMGVPGSLDGGGTDSGKVRVVTFGSTGVAELPSIVGIAKDRAGSSVVLSHDGLMAIVGSMGNEDDTGIVRVHRYDQATKKWVESDAIQGDEVGDLFGVSLSYTRGLDNIDYVAVGASGHDFNNLQDTGNCKVFNLQSTHKVRGSAEFGSIAGEQVGQVVSLMRDILVVASNVASNSTRGIVRVYRFDQDWIEIGSIRGGSEGDFLGSAVSLFQDGTVLVSAKGNATVQGRVYVFGSPAAPT